MKEIEITYNYTELPSKYEKLDSYYHNCHMAYCHSPIGFSQEDHLALLKLISKKNLVKISEKIRINNPKLIDKPTKFLLRKFGSKYEYYLSHISEFHLINNDSLLVPFFSMAVHDFLDKKVLNEKLILDIKKIFKVNWDFTSKPGVKGICEPSQYKKLCKSYEKIDVFLTLASFSIIIFDEKESFSQIGVIEKTNDKFYSFCEKYLSNIKKVKRLLNKNKKSLNDFLKI